MIVCDSYAVAILQFTLKLFQFLRLENLKPNSSTLKYILFFLKINKDPLLKFVVFIECS